MEVGAETAAGDRRVTEEMLHWERSSIQLFLPPKLYPSPLKVATDLQRRRRVSSLNYTNPARKEEEKWRRFKPSQRRIKAEGCKSTTIYPRSEDYRQHSWEISKSPECHKMGGSIT
ncbi:hypothetical protein LINPERPRIM_LOCUS35958 [Linum perenne]